MTGATSQVAVDAFFADARRILAEHGVTEQGLAVLGEELGKLAAAISGRGEPRESAGAGSTGPSRLLRTDPDGLTLVKVRFTSPREAKPVHGHQSWWALRVVNGHEYYTEYDRLDDGSRESYAELRPGPRRFLSPGDVLIALDPVIHCHEDYEGETVEELMLVGENPGQVPVRRFDPEAKTVFVSPPRAYAP